MQISNITIDEWLMTSYPFCWHSAKFNLERDHRGFVVWLMDKIQRLDEIACVTDLNLIKYFNPDKGFSIKQDPHSGSNETEDDGFYFWEESESEGPNLRDTETTLRSQRHKDQSLDVYGAMSLAVNVESKFGTENEQSFSSKARLRKSNKKRFGLTNQSCKPWCSIF